MAHIGRPEDPDQPIGVCNHYRIANLFTQTSLAALTVHVRKYRRPVHEGTVEMLTLARPDR